MRDHEKFLARLVDDPDVCVSPRIKAAIEWTLAELARVRRERDGLRAACERAMEEWGTEDESYILAGIQTALENLAALKEVAP